MNFNFRAVTKKQRLQKTLILLLPFSLVAIIAGALVIMILTSSSMSLLYYGAFALVGAAVGEFVKRIGRGTTIEFMIIAVIAAIIITFFAFYLSLYFQFKASFSSYIDWYFTTDFMSGYLYLAISGAAAAFRANTVQMR